MFVTRFSVLIILLISITSSVSATAADSSNEIDARLAQKVTYAWHNRAVRLIVEDLSKMTGVTLRAGQNEQDWQVRDRRMNIFVKDLPLSNLMNSISRVMGFKWTQNDTVTPPVYRLTMDRKILLGAEAQRARDEARYREMISNTRKAVLNKAADFDRLSDAEKTNLKEEDPQVYLLGMTGFGAAYEAFVDELGSQVDAMQAGKRVTLNSSDLSAAAQQKLLVAMQKMTLTSKEGETLTKEQLARDIANIKLGVVPFDEIDPDDNLERRPIICGGLWFVDGEFHDAETIVDPADRILNEGRLVDKLAETEGRDPDKAWHEWYDERGRTLYDDDTTAPTAQKLPESGESAKDHPNDPSLDVKVTYNHKVKYPYLWYVESILAKSANLSVVSDSFQPLEPKFANVNEGELELISVLENIGSEYKSNWSKQGQTIEFKDRQWFRKRSLQIPDAWINRWRKDFVTEGTLDLDELAEIDRLSFEQHRVNISPDEIISDVLYDRGESAVLSLYEHLNEEQWAAIFSRQGLDLRTVSKDSYVADLYKLTDFFTNPESQAVMRGTRYLEGKSIIYELKVVPSAGLEPFVWKYTTPEYKPPKKENS